MKRYTFLPLLSLFFAAHAQEADSSQNFQFGTYLSFSNLYPDALLQLNQQLRSAQRLDLRDDILGVNFGFTQRFADQNSYLTTRLGFFSMTDTEDSDDHTRLNLWELSAIGHYDVIPNHNWLAYPYIGLGFNVASLNLLTQTPSTFEASLSTPDDGLLRQKYRAGLMTFADLGLGLERALRFTDVTLFIGAKGGYRFSFSEPWNIDGLRYFTETEFSTQGWMFELVLRSELADPQNSRNKRGLFEFFQ